jgi:uncharacterized membrane protein
MLKYFPLALFISFCSPDYKQVQKVKEVYAAKQNDNAENIEVILNYLKTEHDNGHITDEEYNTRRKYLIDKL